MTVSLRDARSAALYERALAYLPGGVNSPVRAMRAIGRDPIFVQRAEGAELVDVDNNSYVDWVCSWGPLIHGHAHPAIVAAVIDAAQRGTSFGAPTAAEVDLAERRRAERRPALGGVADGVDDLRVGVAVDQRAPGADPVDVAVVVDVDQLGALGAIDEDRVAPDRAHRADGGVDAAGQVGDGAGVVLGRARVGQRGGHRRDRLKLRRARVPSS